MQIQTAKLAPVTTVDQSTVKWQELPLKDSDNVANFKDGEILFGVEKYWFTRKYLTGVQLQLQSRKRVRLVIYGKEINAQSFGLGILDKKENSFFDSTTALNSDRIKLDDKLPGLNTSIDVAYPKYQVIKTFLIVFTQKADGSSTFPFFDTTPMTYDTKSALGGIGFFYYTNDDRNAGFIRPYLVPVNYKSFFDRPTHEEQTFWNNLKIKNENLLNLKFETEKNYE